jgi:hypothetical protein
MIIPAPAIVPSNHAAPAAQVVAARKTPAGSQAAVFRPLLDGAEIFMSPAAPDNAANATLR